MDLKQSRLLAIGNLWSTKGKHHIKVDEGENYITMLPWKLILLKLRVVGRIREYQRLGGEKCEFSYLATQQRASFFWEQWKGERPGWVGRMLVNCKYSKLVTTEYRSITSYRYKVNRVLEFTFTWTFWAGRMKRAFDWRRGRSGKRNSCCGNNVAVVPVVALIPVTYE